MKLISDNKQALVETAVRISSREFRHPLSTHPASNGKRGEALLLEISSAQRDGVWFSVVTNPRGKLVACAFSDRSRKDAEEAEKSWLPKKSRSRLTRRAAPNRQVDPLVDFYRGRGKRMTMRSFDLSWVSDFRRDVYALLCRIPRGKVTTYGALAKRLGGRRYARAVGTAVATNPLPLIVPCHRVVPSSLKVGNYGMCGRDPSTGGYMKRRLLEREGVSFDGDRVSRASIWNPK